ncbi:ATP-dependent DNA ligase [Tardiphaga sp. 71_E8_N1_1]|uniref:ATP-dependent DNA ligase n=1 Tax=Tardiphaga sp. 71_E8_N1_1 TaxID=3240784 RepID=UPI003F88DEB0
MKAAFPGFVAPALASSIGKVPSGGRWIHEVKFDGYRVQLHIANEGIHIYTRRGHDWTDRFKKIATDAWHLKTKSAIVDGEVVVPAEDGTKDFAVLQKVLRAGRPSDLLVIARIKSPATSLAPGKFTETNMTGLPSRPLRRATLLFDEVLLSSPPVRQHG